ncbi:MAG TPA: hypothetical protein VFC67_01735 [Prolixibacteraceae bacterium]|nr:hypothetical protein [Prolixibacteraceae bacterium]
MPLKEIADKKAPENLSAYFKSETELPDDRHFFANWWGVLQLWNIQKAVEKLAGKTIISNIETSFSGSLKEMNSYQGLLARYIKKTPISNIEHHLKELSAIKAEKFLNEDRNRNELQQEIKLLSDNNIECNIQIQILKETLAESQTGFLKKLLSQLNSYPSAIQRKIEEIQGRKESIKNQVINNQEYLELTELIEYEKNSIYELNRKINRKINSVISALEENKNFSTNEFSLELIRKKLTEEKPQIVFVDDQANDGWAAIFQRMIYGDNSDSFSVIQPNEKDSIDDISIQIIEKIRKTKAHLLILDLRLKGEKGSITEPSQISGVQVLKKLKEAKITCPILITTASNKIWSYKETIAAGASAFWIKEGLDEKVELMKSTDNYLRFLDLVYIICFSEEFNFLYKDFQSHIIEIENRNSIFWWESKFWKDKRLIYPKTSEVKKEEILECFDQAFQLFEDYLKLRIQSLDNARLNNNIASLIVVQFARILEIIHSVDNQKSQVTLSDKMKDQLSDSFYKRWTILLALRNGITHSFIADFFKMKNFILRIFEYLNDDINDDYFVENKKYLLQEPIAGNSYESKILSKHPTYETYYLENPGLNLLDKRDNIVLDKRFNKQLDSQMLEGGMKIRFELKIVDRDSGFNYFAVNSEILNQ